MLPPKSERQSTQSGLDQKLPQEPSLSLKRWGALTNTSPQSVLPARARRELGACCAGCAPGLQGRRGRFAPPQGPLGMSDLLDPLMNLRETKSALPILHGPQEKSSPVDSNHVSRFVFVFVYVYYKLYILFFFAGGVGVLASGVLTPLASKASTALAFVEESAFRLPGFVSRAL